MLALSALELHNTQVMSDFMNDNAERLLPGDEIVAGKILAMGLGDDATERLIKSALPIRTNKQGDMVRAPEYVFGQEGLLISRLDEDEILQLGKFAVNYTGKLLHNIAQYGIDFAPDGKTNRTIGKFSKTVIGAVNAFEDFMTLVNGGIIEQPEILVGVTNDIMANFARRAAFKIVGVTEYSQPVVIAPYDGLCEAIHNFDPTLRVRLTERIKSVELVG